jgi:rubrerythrin
MQIINDKVKFALPHGKVVTERGYIVTSTLPPGENIVLAEVDGTVESVRIAEAMRWRIRDGEYNMSDRIEVGDVTAEDKEQAIQTIGLKWGVPQIMNHGTTFVQYRRTGRGKKYLETDRRIAIAKDSFGKNKMGALLLEWNAEAYTQQYCPTCGYIWREEGDPTDPQICPDCAESVTFATAVFGAWVGSGGSGSATATYRISGYLGFCSGQG